MTDLLYKYGVLFLGMLFVLIGAFFKILHLNYAQYILILGLITEVIGLIRIIRLNKK